MVTNKSIEESEKPAKVWQMQELSNKIDALSQSQSEIKTMIAAQNATYPTKTELALELEKRDNKIAELKKNLAAYNKVVWLIASTLIPVVALIIWQLIVNNAGLGAK